MCYVKSSSRELIASSAAAQAKHTEARTGGFITRSTASQFPHLFRKLRKKGASSHRGRTQVVPLPVIRLSSPFCSSRFSARAASLSGLMRSGPARSPCGPPRRLRGRRPCSTPASGGGGKTRTSLEQRCALHCKWVHRAESFPQTTSYF